MKKRLVTLLTALFLFMLGADSLFAQVAINTTGSAANAHAMLDVQSDTAGILIPRLTTTQRYSLLHVLGDNEQGLLVYDSDEQRFYYYNGSVFTPIQSGKITQIADNDDDTKVETDHNDIDEDMVRITLAGTEYFQFSGASINVKNSGGSVFLGDNAGSSDDLSNNHNTFIGYNSGNNIHNGWDNTALGYYSLYNPNYCVGNVAIGIDAIRSNSSGNYNQALGYYSMYHNTTGSYNTAMGYKTLYSNQTKSNLVAIGDSALFHNGELGGNSYEGSVNTAVGSKALCANTQGYDNTAAGYKALKSNTLGYSNTAFGSYTLHGATTASGNVAIGYRSLLNHKTGNNNVAVGTDVLYSDTTGYSNVAMGIRALYQNDTGSNLVAIGDSALYNNKASLNTALGSKALYSNTSGAGNTATGYHSMTFNTSGAENTAVGLGAMNANTTGSYNVAYGAGALQSNTSGALNTSIGYQALDNNLSGSSNVAIGQWALYSNTSGFSNIALGNSALFHSQTKHNLVAIGDSALFNNGIGAADDEALYNTAVGSKALYTNSTGERNTAMGYQALYSNSIGTRNTATGHRSLEHNTEGEENTANGYRSLHSNTTGLCNTAMGSSALAINTTGEYNTAIGYEALLDNSTGSHNTAVGAYTTGFFLNLSGCVYLGYKAGINNGFDNRLYIADNDTNTLIYGEFDNELVQINGDFTVKNPGVVTSTIESTDNTASLKIKASGANLGQIKFYDNGSFGGSMGYSNSDNHLFFYQGSHNVFIENGNIVPGAHKEQNLGSSTMAWGDIYCDNLNNVGAAAFTDRKVTKELLNHPPKAKPEGAFDEKTEKGLKELDPNSVPDELRNGYAILTDEIATYNYKANYEQQVQIEELIKAVKLLKNENKLLKQELDKLKKVSRN